MFLKTHEERLAILGAHETLFLQIISNIAIMASCVQDHKMRLNSNLGLDSKIGLQSYFVKNSE